MTRIKVDITRYIPYASGCLPESEADKNKNIHACWGAKPGLGTEIFLLVSKFLNLDLEFVYPTKMERAVYTIHNMIKNNISE